MPSNSKLSKIEKQARKDMIAALPGGSSMALSDAGVTFLVVPMGAIDRVYTSVASPDETKIRRKVGEFHALSRWNLGMDGFAVPAGHWDAELLALTF